MLCRSRDLELATLWRIKDQLRRFKSALVPLAAPLGGKIEETAMGEEKRDCYRPERVRAGAPCYLGNLYSTRERQL
jgi:hypothetical protein